MVTAPNDPPLARYTTWRVVDVHGAVRARALTDRRAGELLLCVPGRAAYTLDVVTARAFAILLTEAPYIGLDPDGPALSLERVHHPPGCTR